MLELNVVTAIPIGGFAAFVWAAVLLRRLLRLPRVGRLSRNQKLVVVLTSAIALVPALIIGFVFAGFLSRFTVVPGVWSHLALALTMVFSMAVIGTAIPVVAGWAVVKGMLRRNMHGLA
jgi:hypothetical protein